jgi:hypothetical protein
MWSAVTGCVALLLLASIFGGHAEARPLGQVCEPPCWQETECQVVGGEVHCQTHCTCPGTTPGATPVGTPFPWTPSQTPTPPPGGNVEWCLPYECAPGETRLWLVWYLYNLGIYQPVRPLEACCGPSCPCREPTDDLQPCQPGIDTECSEWGATVSASLPVWHADRMPYPRALVTLGTSFWTSDANGSFTTDLPMTEVWGSPVDPGHTGATSLAPLSAGGVPVSLAGPGGGGCGCRDDGSCEDNPPPEGTICEFRLGLKAEPGSEPPSWRCEDDGGGIGYRISCLWDHSSAGKEYLGKGLNCEDLPAFAVNASVPYWWSLGRQWEQWEKIGDDCDCECHGGAGSDECGGEPGQCTGANEHWELECEPIYGWKHHGPNWVLLDMRDYGYATPYMSNPLVQLAPYRACGPHPVGVLYVPCIEVQGVISNPKEP